MPQTRTGTKPVRSMSINSSTSEAAEPDRSPVAGAGAGPAGVNSVNKSGDGGAGGTASAAVKKKPAGVKRKQADTTTPPTASMATDADGDRRESGRQIKRVTKDLPDYQPQHASKVRNSFYPK